MISLRILAFVLFVGCFTSCTPSNKAPIDTDKNEPAVPGVGMAPDSSDAVKDSTIQKQQSDTASRHH